MFQVYPDNNKYPLGYCLETWFCLNICENHCTNNVFWTRDCSFEGKKQYLNFQEIDFFCIYPDETFHSPKHNFLFISYALDGRFIWNIHVTIFRFLIYFDAQFSCFKNFISLEYIQVRICNIISPKLHFIYKKCFHASYYLHNFTFQHLFCCFSLLRNH